MLHITQSETEKKRADVLNPNENQRIRKEVSHFTMQTESRREKGRDFTAPLYGGDSQRVLKEKRGIFYSPKC